MANARVDNENKIYSPTAAASGVHTLGGATNEARDFEKKMASGGLSLAQQQLRQGLSSAAQQQAAMGAGGGLSARAGMLAGAQQASQGVGQSAALRSQEEAGARQQTMGALTNQAAGQAAHAGQQMQASQAQAEHHAAMMAENRAQEEADRAFGMEIAGALVGAVSGGASLMGGGDSSIDIKDSRSTGERSSLMTSPGGTDPYGNAIKDPINTYEGKFPGLRGDGTFGKNVSSEKLQGALSGERGSLSPEGRDVDRQVLGDRSGAAPPEGFNEPFENPQLSPPDRSVASLAPYGSYRRGEAAEDANRRPEYRRESVLPGIADRDVLGIDSQREYANTQGTSDQNVYKGNNRNLEHRSGDKGEFDYRLGGGDVRDAGYMPSRVWNRQSKSLAETMGKKAYDQGFTDYREGLAADKKSKAAQDWKERAGASRYARKKKDKGTRKYSDDLGGKIERGFQRYKDSREDARYDKSKLGEKIPKFKKEMGKLKASQKSIKTGKPVSAGPQKRAEEAFKEGGLRGVIQAAGGVDPPSEMRGKEPLPPNYLAGWKPMYPGEQPGDHLSSVTSSERNPRYGTNDVVETREDGSRVNRSLEQEKRSKLADFMNRLDEEGTNARRADDEMAMHVGRRVRERMQTAPERERGFERTDSGDVNETLDGLQTYPYTYKKPEDRPKEGRGLDLDQGPRRGPMAEELGETPLGKEAVIDTPTGEKIHHDNYLYGVVTPGLKEVHEREKDTRSKVDALSAQLDRLGAETERRMAGGKKKRGRAAKPKEEPRERMGTGEWDQEFPIPYESGPTFDDVRQHMDVVEETPPLPSYQDPNEGSGDDMDDKTRAAVDRYRNFYDHLSGTVPTSHHRYNPRGFSFSQGTQRELEDRHGKRK